MLDDKKHDEILKGLLENALAAKPTAVHFNTRSKANEFGVYPTDVEQILVEMAGSGFIQLEAWDGSAAAPYTQ